MWNDIRAVRSNAGEDMKKKIIVMMILALVLVSCGNAEVQEITDRMNEYEEMYMLSNEKIVFDVTYGWSYSDGAAYHIICNQETGKEYILHKEKDKIILVPITED